jgi:hypothetical protein
VEKQEEWARAHGKGKGKAVEESGSWVWLSWEDQGWSYTGTSQDWQEQEPWRENEPTKVDPWKRHWEGESDSETATSKARPSTCASSSRAGGAVLTPATDKAQRPPTQPSTKETTKEPLKKASAASASSSATDQLPPLEKGDTLRRAPLTFEQKQERRCAVDWHNTLEVYGEISERNKDALRMLIEQGYEITILSFAGYRRAEQVVRLAKGLKEELGLRRIKTLDVRTGNEGKVDWCYKFGIPTLFDDNEEICREALQFNLNVFPIRTRWQKHDYLEKGRSFHDLREAVEFFLRTDIR